MQTTHFNVSYANMMFDQQLARLGLNVMWDHIKATNPGKDNKYHNTYHMYHMARITLDLLRTTPTYSSMSKEGRFTLETLAVTAALWHDYGHSGGALPDSENIKIACDAFEAYWRDICQQTPDTNHTTVELFITAVRNAIEVTEYPFVKTPAGAVAIALRDADLLYTFMDNTGEIVYGLYQELLPKLNHMPFRQFLDAQTGFHDSVTLYTEVGQSIHAHYKGALIAEQERWALEQGLIPATESSGL